MIVSLNTTPQVDVRQPQLRAKEFEMEGLQQKLLDKQDILRDSTSSLDDERPRRKLGDSSFSDLAKRVEEKNYTLEEGLQEGTEEPNTRRSLQSNNPPAGTQIVITCPSLGPYTYDWNRELQYWNRELHMAGIESWVRSEYQKLQSPKPALYRHGA